MTRNLVGALMFFVAGDEASTGPASLTQVDPDGTPIAIDQHVRRPRK